MPFRSARAATLTSGKVFHERDSRVSYTAVNPEAGLAPPWQRGDNGAPMLSTRSPETRLAIEKFGVAVVVYAIIGLGYLVVNHLVEGRRMYQLWTGLDRMKQWASKTGDQPRA